MKEAAVVFNEDVREKAATARGVYGRKGKCGGRKSPKFPSDYMKKKEKDSMNGPVCTMDPHKFYTWEDFKALTSRLQVEYLNYIINKYNIGLSRISTMIFGMSRRALSDHLERKGLLNQVKYHLVSNRPAEADLERLRKDMEAQGVGKIEVRTEAGPYNDIKPYEKEVSTIEAIRPKDEVKAESTEEPVKESQEMVKINGFQSMTLNMIGLNLDYLSQLAKAIPAKVKVHITIEGLEDSL